MLSKIFNTIKDLSIKNDLKQSFQSIEKQVDQKIDVIYKEPSMEPAIRYLELNSRLINEGWLSNPIRHPRDSDK